mmetsp:Transcript_32958/g.49121  ORF Transcript_32958/g.49121 Transcript_32958/m.49121 type:complete len:81 (+) Transcript_32958:260-502(+)
MIYLSRKSRIKLVSSHCHPEFDNNAIRNIHKYRKIQIKEHKRKMAQSEFGSISVIILVTIFPTGKRRMIFDTSSAANSHF